MWAGRHTGITNKQTNIQTRTQAQKQQQQNVIIVDDDDELMLNVLRCHLTY